MGSRSPHFHAKRLQAPAADALKIVRARICRMSGSASVRSITFETERHELFQSRANIERLCASPSKRFAAQAIARRECGPFYAVQ